MIHWHWVIAAFFGGVTLVFLLEIRQRRQTKHLALGFYFLPVFTLALSIGIVLFGMARTEPQTKTAVLPSLPQATPPHTQTQTPASLADLPTPQIVQHTQPTPSTNNLEPSPTPPQTAVRRLRIPALKLNKPVHTIPLEDGLWNVANLGSDVGWLETTAVHPDADQAMVFVGHMTYANVNLLEQGAFADIPSLPYGTAVILETDTGDHTYLVDSVRRVAPDDTNALYEESGDTILLLTCADWNPQQGIYETRLLVRASRQSH